MYAIYIGDYIMVGQDLTEMYDILKLMHKDKLDITKEWIEYFIVVNIDRKPNGTTHLT